MANPKKKQTNDISDAPSIIGTADQPDGLADTNPGGPPLGDSDGAPVKEMTLAQLKAAYEDANDRSEVAALERNDFGTKIAAAMAKAGEGRKSKPTITLGGVRYRVTKPRDGAAPELMKVPSVEYLDLDADPAS